MSPTETTRIAWRRLHAAHDYVGTLATTEAGVRLDGREPSSGIELSLSIPFSEIEGVSASNGSCGIAGESAVVLELAGSEPVLVREVGPGPQATEQLVRRLSRLRGKARRTRGR
jgi:hypothetical protein